MHASPTGPLDSGFDGDPASPDYPGNGAFTINAGHGDHFGINMVAQPDGKILVASITDAGSSTTVQRFNTDGSYDQTWSDDGIAYITTGGGWSANLSIAPDGSVYTSFLSGGAQPGLLKLTPSGQLDESFDGDVGDSTYPANGLVSCSCMSAPGLSEFIIASVVQPDGKVVYVVNNVTATNTTTGLIRRGADGGLDTSFGVGGKAEFDLDVGGDDNVQSILLDPDGKIVVAGTNGSGEPLIARFTSSGALDTGSFHAPDGFAELPIAGADTHEVNAVARDSQGRYLIAGAYDAGNDDTAQQGFVARITSGGALDTTYSPNDDGFILLDSDDPFPTGTIFGNFFPVIKSLVVFENDRVAVHGLNNIGGEFSSELILLTADGALDTSLDTDGRITRDHAPGIVEFPMEIAQGSDGSIVGASVSVNPVVRVMLTRWEAPTIQDYDEGATDFTLGASALGFCLQSHTGPTSTPLLKSSTCPLADGGFWNAISNSAGSGSTVASTTTSMASSAGVTLNFGLRGGTATPGSYVAPLVIEVVSPQVTPPANTVVPTITGTAEEKRTLTSTQGTWTGSPTISYERSWLRCDAAGDTCAAIGGENGASYTIGSADVGSTIRHRVEATNSEGTVVANSVQSGVVAAYTPLVRYTTGAEQGTVASPGIYSAVQTAGGGSVASSTLHRNGNHSLRVDASASGNNYVDRNITAGTRTVVARMYVRFNELPTSTFRITSLTLTPGWHCAVQYDPATGRLQGYINPSVQAGPQIEARQWYLIDYRCDATSGTRTLDWSVDGQAQTQVSEVAAAADIDSLRIGNDADNAAATIFYDDIAYSHDSADYPLNHGKVLSYKPDGVATISTPGSFDFSTDNGGGWTAFTGGDENQSPGQSVLIDDWPVTTGAGADLWRQGATVGDVEIDVENTAETAPPNAVRLVGGHRNTGGASTVFTSITDNGAGGLRNMYSSALISAPLGYFEASTPYQAGTSAGCGAPPCAWTTADFNDTRIVLDATDVTDPVMTDSLMIEADFPAAAPPANTVAPVISGLMREGAQLEATTGSWTGSPSAYEYQWLRCDSAGITCADIGTNSNHYTLVAGDVSSTMRVEVRATGLGGIQSKLSGIAGPISSAAPTLTYHTGFEHGTKSTAGAGLFNTETISGSGSLDVVSTPARSGQFALSSSVDGGVAAHWQKNTSGGPEHVVRFSVMITQQPTTAARIFELDDLGAGNGAVKLMVDTSLQSSLEMNSDDTNPWEVQETGATLELFRWHTFEVMVNGTTGDARWMVDGVEQTSGNCGCTMAPDAARIGLFAVAPLVASALYDDVAFSETAADFPIGTGRGSALTPSGIGAIDTPASFDWSIDNGGGWNTVVGGDANQSPGLASHVDEWPIDTSATADSIRQTATAGDMVIELNNTNEPLAVNSIRGISAISDAGFGSSELGYSEGAAASYLYSAINAAATVEYRAGTAPRRAASAGAGTWTPTAVNDTYLLLDTAAAITQTIESLIVEVDAPTSPAPIATTDPQLLTPYSSVKVGDTLSVDNGTWTGDTGFFSYSWLRCTPVVGAEDLCEGIAGETANSYTVQAADLGTHIRALVTTNGYIASRQVAASDTTSLVANENPTLEFVSGFETGEITGTNPDFLWGSGHSIDSTTKRTGNYSMRNNPIADQSFITQPAGGINTFVGRFYVRFDSWPTANSSIFETTGTGPSGQRFIILPTGQVELGVYENWISCDTSAGPSLTLGQWHQVDLRTTMNSTTWTIEAAIDGVEITPASCIGRPIKTIDVILIGAIGSVNVDQYTDDVAWSSTADDYPIGPGRVEPLTINAAGTHATPASFRDDTAAALTPSTWNRLDEVPMSPTTDFIEQHTIGATDYAEWLFSDPLTAATARLVKVTVGTHSSSATPNNATTKIIRTEDWLGNGPIIHTGDMSGTTIAYRILNIPTPGPGWTQTELNALKLRTGYATNTDSLPAWDNAVAEAEYRD